MYEVNERSALARYLFPVRLDSRRTVIFWLPVVKIAYWKCGSSKQLGLISTISLVWHRMLRNNRMKFSPNDSMNFISRSQQSRAHRRSMPGSLSMKCRRHSIRNHSASWRVIQRRCSMWPGRNRCFSSRHRWIKLFGYGIWVDWNAFVTFVMWISSRPSLFIHATIVTSSPQVSMGKWFSTRGESIVNP